MATVFPFRANLLNGAVSNMAVNGSVTPQNFDFAPTTATERFQIFESSFILSTAGNVNELITKFADFAPLTNGLDLSFLFSGQTYNLTGLTAMGITLAGKMFRT